jgi:hypothetical protein
MGRAVASNRTGVNTDTIHFATRAVWVSRAAFDFQVKILKTRRFEAWNSKSFEWTLLDICCLLGETIQRSMHFYYCNI